MAVLAEDHSVTLTWTPPSPAPPGGYLVFVPTANIYDYTSDTSYLTTPLSVGVHTIRVETVSAYYFGQTETNLIVRGEGVGTFHKPRA